MFPGLDLYCSDPAQKLIAADYWLDLYCTDPAQQLIAGDYNLDDLDDLNRDLFDV